MHFTCSKYIDELCNVDTVSVFIFNYQNDIILKHKLPHTHAGWFNEPL